MKLTNELKNRIDDFFDNISSEALIELSIRKYKFSEITFEIKNEFFFTVAKSFYLPSELSDTSYTEDTNQLCTVSSAA